MLSVAMTPCVNGTVKGDVGVSSWTAVQTTGGTEPVNATVEWAAIRGLATP